MKRLFQILMAIWFISILVFVPFHFCYGAGSVSIASSTITVQAQPTRKIITLSWACEAGAATIPNTTIGAETYGIKGWYFYSAETNPGATAPTTLYDITILDADGADLAGSLLMNRSATLTEGPIAMALGTTGHPPVVRGDLTFTLSNNAVNAALGTCILVFIAN